MQRLSFFPLVARPSVRAPARRAMVAADDGASLAGSAATVYAWQLLRCLQGHQCLFQRPRRVDEGEQRAVALEPQLHKSGQHLYFLIAEQDRHVWVKRPELVARCRQLLWWLEPASLRRSMVRVVGDGKENNRRRRGGGVEDERRGTGYFCLRTPTLSWHRWRIRATELCRRVRAPGFR